jgi:hypothetical protein
VQPLYGGVETKVPVGEGTRRKNRLPVVPKKCSTGGSSGQDAALGTQNCPMRFSPHKGWKVWGNGGPLFGRPGNAGGQTARNGGGMGIMILVGGRWGRDFLRYQYPDDVALNIISAGILVTPSGPPC